MLNSRTLVPGGIRSAPVRTTGRAGVIVHSWGTAKDPEALVRELEAAKAALQAEKEMTNRITQSVKRLRDEVERKDTEIKKLSTNVQVLRNEERSKVWRMADERDRILKEMAGVLEFPPPSADDLPPFLSELQLTEEAIKAVKGDKAAAPAAAAAAAAAKAKAGESKAKETLSDKELLSASDKETSGPEKEKEGLTSAAKPKAAAAKGPAPAAGAGGKASGGASRAEQLAEESVLAARDAKSTIEVLQVFASSVEKALEPVKFTLKVQEEFMKRELGRWDDERRRFDAREAALTAEVEKLREELKGLYVSGIQTQQQSMSNLTNAAIANLNANAAASALGPLAPPSSSESRYPTSTSAAGSASPAPSAPTSYSAMISASSSSASAPSSHSPPSDSYSDASTSRSTTSSKPASSKKANEPDADDVSNNGLGTWKREMGGPPALVRGADDIYWVDKLHRALSRAGYYPGDEDIEDWFFGDGTMSAVLTFQACSGLTETGSVDRNTWGKLLGRDWQDWFDGEDSGANSYEQRESSSSSSYSGNGAAAAAAAAAAPASLDSWMSDSASQQYNTNTNTSGNSAYDTYSAATSSDPYAYQNPGSPTSYDLGQSDNPTDLSDYGAGLLPQNSAELDREIRELTQAAEDAVNDVSKLVDSFFKEFGAVKGAGEPMIPDVAPPRLDLPTAPPLTGNKLPILREGDGNRDVHVMQIMLQRKGFFCGEDDCTWWYFGDDTVGALKTFQESLGMPESGVCDERTWKALLGPNATLATLQELARQDLGEFEEDMTEQGEGRVWLMGEQRWAKPNKSATGESGSNGSRW